MSIWSEFGELGTNIVDTAGDWVEGIGTGFQASANQRAANIEAQRLQMQIAAQKFAAEQRRKDEMQKALNVVIYAVVVLISAFAIVNIYRTLKK